MSGDQSAKASNDSVVVQSQGDTNIGYSASDMQSIIETLADQVPKFAAIASAIVEERLKTFESKLMLRFEDTKATDARAFADPDFQYLVGRSQHAYARSGDDKTADILVDLIAQRSMQTARTRLTLSLNDAVEKSAYLTQNEFAELSLSFLLRYTIRQKLSNIPQLCEYLKRFSGPFISDISNEQSSYSYLESQSCASIGVLESEIIDILKNNYGGIITNGIELAAFQNQLGENPLEKLPGLIIPCINNSSNFQINAINKEQLKQKLVAFGAIELADGLWNVHSSGFMNKQQFIEAAIPHFSEVESLFIAWDDSPIGSLQLTSVGMAIGYANLKRLTGFETDLSIWIK